MAYPVLPDPSKLTADELSALRAKLVSDFQLLNAGKAIEGVEGVDIELAAEISEQVKVLNAETATRAAAAEAADVLAAERAAKFAELDPETAAETAAVTEGEPTSETAEDTAPITEVTQLPTPVAPVANDAPLPIAASSSNAGLAVIVKDNRPLPISPNTFSTGLGLPEVVQPHAAHESRRRTNEVALVSAGDFNTGREGGNARVQSGTTVDLKTLGQVAAEAHRLLGPSVNGDGRVHLASFSAPYRDDECLTGDPEHDGKVVELAISRAQGGSAESLTAGGHCAPAISIYTFCNIATLDGLWDVPMIASERGRVQWPVSPTLADWMGRNANWLWTPAMDILGTATKECFPIPCQAYQPACEVEDHYLCLSFQNMTSRSWPELYQEQIMLALMAHRYRVSFRFLQRAVASSTPITLNAAGDSAWSAIMSGTELQVEGLRERHSTGGDFVFEMALPMWLKAALRADLSRRTGVDLTTELDAKIVEGFNARGVRPQFVRGLQPLVPGTGLPTAYPTSALGMIYPAGRFLGLAQPRLDLGMEIRDMSTIAKNTFAGFVEDSSVLCAPCFESEIVTFTNLNFKGNTGAANLV